MFIYALIHRMKNGIHGGQTPVCCVEINCLLYIKFEIGVGVGGWGVGGGG